MSPMGVSILHRVSEMAGEGGPGNSEQLGRASLIAIGLFVNKMDVPPDRAGQSQIHVAVLFVPAICHRQRAMTLRFAMRRL